jgi:hypothetical protein
MYRGSGLAVQPAELLARNLADLARALHGSLHSDGTASVHGSDHVEHIAQADFCIFRVLAIALQIFEQFALLCHV